jgi:hypothetical protein
MNRPNERVEFVHDFLAGIFAGDLHAKRVASLANGTLGVMTSASLAVSMYGCPRLRKNFFEWLGHVIGCGHVSGLELRRHVTTAGRYGDTRS